MLGGCCRHRGIVTTSLDRFIASLVAPSNEHADQARQYHQRLAKPVGSLGRLESLGSQLCGIYRVVPPPPMSAAVAVFAGDHGVVKEGVSAWPSEVTAQMVLAIADGTAAVSVLARASGASVKVIDVGVGTTFSGSDNNIDVRRVRAGTANLVREPAMTVYEAEEALSVGADIAAELFAGGANVLVGGDVGIGNTTAATALISAICDVDPSLVTGRSPGIDEVAHRHKVAVVHDAVARCGSPDDPVELLAELGGLEIAALAGFYIAAASLQVPVILDGVVCVAAALIANEIDPIVSRYFVAGHRSKEPGAAVGLGRLRLEPLLDLELRLGEASGAVLALPLLDSAGRILREMATLDSAAISGPDERK
jgi:nicotinate-nucleotide--dimethylbenzimidazole phosphoribosyltransferase